MQSVKVTKNKREETKSFSVRKRKDKWEYRIEGERINGKRHQITKCGFPTKEEAVVAASEYIKTMSTHFV